MEHWLNRYRHLIPTRFTTNFILESIHFLLKNNIFKIFEQFFKQLIGTAMGSPFASFCACLTIGFLEETILLPELSIKFNDADVKNNVDAYNRFMDGGIVLLPRQICENDFLKLERHG